MKPSSSDWRSAESVLMRFEDAWRKSGEASISQFLPNDDAAQRQYLLEELIKIDMEHRWGNGDPRTIEQYLIAFPELGTIDTVAIDLIACELSVRQDHHESLTTDDIFERFSSRSSTTLARIQSQLETTRKKTRARSRSVPLKPKTTGASGRNIGRYELRGELGRGASAVVYRAWDPKLQREVAIKVTRAEFVEDEELRERMLREARAAAKLQHPGIVPTYEVGDADGLTFIVSELVEGETLRERLEHNRPTLVESCDWMIAIGEAVHYAHQCQVVHRDIKPANVLLKNDCNPVLTDFGLAHQSDALATFTMHGQIIGTPAFMAPEQATGRSREVDARSDVYSLGVMLYQLLCGELPFAGSTASVLKQVAHDDPKSPRTVRREVPIDLDTICSKAIAKEPAQRYTSALEFAQDLRRWRNREPILARRLHPLGRLALWCARQPKLAGTIAFCLLIVTLVASVSYSRVVQERNRYRIQRDRAEASLYRSLISDARSQQQAKGTSWWWNALGNVEQAAKLNVALRDRRELRDLATQVMGDRQPCFRMADEWRGHIGKVNTITMDSQGRFVVSAGVDKTLRVWSIHSGRQIASRTLDLPCQLIAIHPSGDWMLTYDSKTLKSWNLQPLDAGQGAAGKELPPPTILRRPDAKISDIQFSPDGQRVAIASGSELIVTSAMNEHVDLPENRLVGHTEEVLCLSWANDSRMLASASLDLTLRVWDAERLVSVRQRNTVDPIRVLKFSGTSDRTLAAADAESLGIQVLDLSRDTVTRYATIHRDAVIALAKSPDGFVTASRDGTLRLTSSGEQIAIAKDRFPVINSAVISPSGKTVFAAYRDGVIRKWKLQSSPFVHFLEAEHKTDFHPTKNALATDWGVIQFAQGKPVSRNRLRATEYTAFKCYQKTNRQVGATAQGRLELIHDGETIVKDRQAHVGRIHALAIDDESPWIATAGADEKLCVWDRESLRQIHALDPGLGELHCVALNPAAQLIAISGRYGVVVWRANESLHELRRVDKFQIRSAVEFVGHRVAMSDAGGSIRIVDIRDGEDSLLLRGHQGEVTALLATPNGKLLSAGQDSVIRLWDIESNSELRRWNAIGTPRWIALEAERKILATGAGAHSKAFYDWDRSEPIAEIREWGLGFGQFETRKARLLMASDRGYIHFVRISDLPIGPKGGLQPANTKGLFTYDNVTRPGRHQQTVWGVEVSPDGRWIATASHDQSVKLWDAESHDLKHTLTGEDSLVWSIAFSPDSKYLATGSADEKQGCIGIWNVQTGQLVNRLRGHTKLVRGLAYHPNGRWLASASADKTVMIWDMRAGEPHGRLHAFDQWVHDIAFDPEGGRLAAACHDNQVAVWDIDQKSTESQFLKRCGKPRFLHHEIGRVWAVAFSPDGKYLASGTDEGQVVLWDVAELNALVTLKTDVPRIRSLSFSHDASLLGVGSYDALSPVWDLAAVRRRLRELQLDW